MEPVTETNDIESEMKEIEIEIDTPIWILEPNDGILPLIVRLPDNQEIFSELELSGFDRFASSCFLKFVLQLQGQPIDGITKSDFEPVLPNESIVLTMFQKDYMKTTKTFVVNLNAPAEKANEYMKHDKSLPVFKNSKVIDKLDVKLLIDENTLYFAYFGKLELNSDEVNQLKQKIY